jgi:hypothetical protein
MVKGKELQKTILRLTGHKQAASVRDIVASSLSSAEIAEGQRRAAAFVSQKENPSLISELPPVGQ